MRELKGTRTEANLEAAFAGESQARSRYLFFAQKAETEGLGDIALLFRSVAENEAEHALHEFELLGRLGDTKANLETAVRGESREHETYYPDFATAAREEGREDIAAFFDRMALVEGRHRDIFQAALGRLAGEAIGTGRTVRHSEAVMAQLMLPHQANPAGFVHGGELMKMMDNAAAVVAYRHARTNVVTARVDDLSFLAPVKVGHLLQIEARLTFVSRSSMEVRVEVSAEDLTRGERRKALTAYFVMVSLDDAGGAREVPPLLVTTEAEEALFEAGRLRRETRRAGQTAG